MHAQPGCERRVHTPRYTPPAEVYLRYICALTSRYAGWPSQPEQGRTRRDSHGRRGWYGQPPTGRRGPGAARAGAKTAGWRMTPSSAFPADTGHTAPGASNRGSARHQRGRRSTRKPDSTAHVEPEHAAGTAPSVAVRKTADGAHRPPWGTDPVRYTSVDPATQRPPARQGDTSRDREKTARIAENSQPAGRFRRWWQVLGSNQRRLSRRFYRPLVLVGRYAD